MIPISKPLFPINKVEKRKVQHIYHFLWSALWICYKACWFLTFEANALSLITMLCGKCYLQLQLGTEWWVLYFLEGYSSSYTHGTAAHGLKGVKNTLCLFPVTVNRSLYGRTDSHIGHLLARDEWYFFLNYIWKLLVWSNRWWWTWFKGEFKFNND